MNSPTVSFWKKNPHLRRDAIKAVEILLTASPEAFERNAQGEAKDMRSSQWVQDNLTFLQQKFGSPNVVSFTLHQDETTPHIHAVIIPITREQRLHEGKPVGEAVRLSCRELLSPGSLRRLQTEYAEAMAPYGMERGIKYSTAFHEDVRRHYGAQQTTKEHLAQVAAPLPHTPFVLGEKKWLEHLNPQAYLERELARMNEHLAQQVALVNAKLAEVATVATANTLEHERAKVLEKQLATSKKTQQQATAALEQTKKELAEKTEALLKNERQYNALVMRTAQGEALPPYLSQWVGKVQERSRQRAEQVITRVLQGPVLDGKPVEQALKAEGFGLQKLESGQIVLRDHRTYAQFALTNVRPNGHPFQEQFQQAIARTRSEQEQARRRELAQDPRAAHVLIQAADGAQAKHVALTLEQAGANVWHVQPLAGEQVEVRVSYRLDWNTIEALDQTLTEVRRTPGVQLQEEAKQRSTHLEVIRTIERERERAARPDQSKGISW
ncbi:MobV family relaxase [Hymenobacter sp. GOD-10R]|uniref:MobV family relaxase n=1 Tax=Hymenobacter sp. GOD-10R TaxID=3093922 RepID=UPI002D78C484|nr:MobV family relaxase [Hymenobacter sp. GOD-10R]WRQ31786.1 MobV family relaxase [Hymenobacter sp. GOD-10R]